MEVGVIVSEVIETQKQPNVTYSRITANLRKAEGNHEGRGKKEL